MRPHRFVLMRVRQMRRDSDVRSAWFVGVADSEQEIGDVARRDSARLPLESWEMYVTYVPKDWPSSDFVVPDSVRGDPA